MGTINKLRLLLFPVMTMMGMSMWGQGTELSVVPNELSFEAYGGSKDVEIVATDVWTASVEGDATSWVTVSPTSDTKLTVSVWGNSSTKGRSANITITCGEQEEVITVTQNRPRLSLGESDVVTINADVNEVEFDIFSNANWKVSSDASWLTIISPESAEGSGDDSVILYATANTETEDRTATIIVKNKDCESQSRSFTVKQLAKTIDVTVNTSSLRFENVGSDKSFTITSNVELELVVEYEEGGSGWISLDKTQFQPSGVSGKTEPFKVTVAKNNSLKGRSGKISIRRGGTEIKSVSIVQNGSFASVTVSATSFNFEAQSNGKSQTLVVTSNVPVTIGSVSGDSDWLAVSPSSVTHDDATVSTEKKFTLSVQSDNTSEKERQAKFNITWTDQNGETQTKEITVVQMPKGIDITVNTSSLRFENVGSDKSFTITSNVELELVVEYEEGGSGWISLDKTQFQPSGVSGKTEPFKVTVTKNKSLKGRSGRIVIKRNGSDMAIVAISQDGTSAIINVNSGSFTFDSKAEENSRDLIITSNVPVRINEIDFSETIGQSDWVDVSPVDFTHDDATVSLNKTVKIVVKSENSNDDERIAKFNIVWTDENGLLQSQSIRIVQMGQAVVLAVSHQNINSSDAGLEETIEITSNLNLVLKTIDNATNEEPDWFSVDRTTIISGGVTEQTVQIKVTIDRNVTLKDRNGRIRIMRDGIELASVSVNQSKLTASLTPNSYNVDFGPGKETKQIKLTCNVDWFIDISYINGNDWLSLNPLSGGGYNGDKHETTITLNVEENSDSEDREANVRIHWNNGVNESITIVKIKQKFEENTLNIYSNSGSKEIVFTASATEQKPAKISSNRNWTISCNSSWVHIKPERLEGNGDCDISVSVDSRASEDYYQRTAVLVVETTDKSLRDSIIIRQSGTAYLNSPKSVPFTVKDDIRYADISSNVPWRVFLSEEMSWLKIEEPAELKGEGNGAIKLHADFNENTGSGRSGVMRVKYLGPDGDSIAIDIPITQDRCPIVPEELLLVDTLYTPDGVVEATIRESVNLVVDTTGYDNSDKWIFEWVVNGATQTSETNSLGYEMRDKQMYPVTVKIKYEDDPTNEVLQQSMEFVLYPSPQIPTKLVKKGDGTSGIMIAEFVENNQFANDFNGEYELIFGYGEDTQEGTTYNRYYQYSNKALVTDETVEKWVYTQWEIDNRLIQSKNKRSSTGKSIPNATRSTTAVNAMGSNLLEMTGNRLKVSLPNSTSAYVAVISMSGVVVRDFDLSSNEAINETLDFYELPPGAYIVKCNFGEQGIVKKIVIK